MKKLNDLLGCVNNTRTKASAVAYIPSVHLFSLHGAGKRAISSVGQRGATVLE